MGIFDHPHLTQPPRGLGAMIRNVIIDMQDYNEDTGTGNYRRDKKAEPGKQARGQLIDIRAGGLFLGLLRRRFGRGF